MNTSNKNFTKSDESLENTTATAVPHTPEDVSTDETPAFAGGRSTPSPASPNPVNPVASGDQVVTNNGTQPRQHNQSPE